ncbi:putative lipopolysaccharide heptosyltransferase III [Desulfatirhabdium butyrativorans]|uniref:putative lipopolysaccharide heptosyltransferase III n=1 Tax=Desulfatirhabdium butyrativorans TaxID=340467 RepID=UPI000483680C|nr:putative lipopolysaccharide heptosyltransferase III [Desulfatirhabdium butyrativorans]
MRPSKRNGDFPDLSESAPPKTNTDPQPCAPSPKSVLLIQLGDIGDVVLTLPAVQALRSHYPKARIAVCVREKARDIMLDCPWLDEVFVVSKAPEGKAEHPFEKLLRYTRWFRELRSRHFDVAIELRTGTRGAILAFLSGAPCRIARFAEDGGLWRNRLFHTLVDPPGEMGQYAIEHNLNILRPLGIRVDQPELVFPLPDTRIDQAKRILENAGIPGGDEFVVFHPFSLWPFKEWTIPEGARLIDAIQERTSFHVVVTGAADERERADILTRTCKTAPLNLAGQTTIGELSGILKCARLFIGVDTAALHIAAAVGTPTIGLFGPSSPVSWAPRGPCHQVVSAGWLCMPCRNKGCDNSGQSRCMQTLSADHVISAFFSRSACIGIC